MFPSVFGVTAHNAGLHADAHGIGHHISAIFGFDGALGERQSARQRHRPPSSLETNTVTPLIQRMEKLGILSRKKGDKDHRQQIVSLTPKGKEMEQKAYELIPPAMGERLSACPLQIDDYQMLAEQLDEIIKALKR